MQSTYEQDWFMRQIKLMAAAIARIVFGKDVALYEIKEQAGQTECDKLHLYLLRMIDEGKVNDAEELLFQALSPEKTNALLLALDFYQRLNALGDEALEAMDFSRKEIYDGLREVSNLYGLDIA